MQNNQENSKRIMKNTVFLFFRMALTLIVGLYSSRIILSTLGVSDFGVYNVVGSVVVLFSFFKQALNNATYRFFAYELGSSNLETLKKTFSMALNVHFILAASILLLCEIIGYVLLNFWLNIPQDRLSAANIVFQLSLFSFCIGVIQTPYNSAIIAHEKMSFYAYTSIVEVFLKLGVIFAISFFSVDKLILYGFLLLCVSVIIFFWYIIQCRQLFQECRYHLVWDKSMAKGMVQYSGWSLLVNFVDISVNQSIVFFFNIFFGVVANAALGIANQVNAQLINFLNSFTQSYNPQIIKSYASANREYFIKLIFSTSKLSYFLLLMVSAPIVLNIDFILDIWLKNPPEGTSTFVILMIAYALVDAYSAPLWIGVHATGNLRTHQILMSFVKALNIPLAFFMLKTGLAAWTALASKVILNIICSVIRPCYVKHLYKLPLTSYFKNVWLIVYVVSIISLPFPIFVSSLIEASLFRLCATSLVFWTIFFPVVFWIGLNSKERNMLKKMFSDKIKKKLKKK